MVTFQNVIKKSHNKYGGCVNSNINEVTKVINLMFIIIENNFCTQDD
jgi:hypothetical protein